MKHPQLFTSNSAKWNTPKYVIDLVLKVLGTIELDLWSKARGRKANVPALRYYTEADDSLHQVWKARTAYMNPPYVRRIIDQWVEKLVNAYRAGDVSEAIALVAARTDTDWFKPLFDLGQPICFVHGRLHFSDSETGATFPSALCYMGRRPTKFIEVFGELGEVRVRP